MLILKLFNHLVCKRGKYYNNKQTHSYAILKLQCLEGIRPFLCNLE